MLLAAPMPFFKCRLVVLTFLAFLLSFSGCTHQEPLRIGFAGELSGKHADLGVNGRNGVILAVEMANQAGGIAGRSIDLLIKDDLGTPEGARQADRELIQSGVAAIIGHMTSAQTLAGLEVTEPAGVILFSPTTSTPVLTGIDDNFLRLYPTNLTLSRALAQHIFTASGLQRMAVIQDRDNAPYSQTFAEGFSQAYSSLGGQVTAEITFSSQEYEAGKLAASALESQPQGLLIVAAGPDTALLAQHARLVDPAILLFTTAWAQTESLVKNGGKAVEGIQLVQAYDASFSSPTSQDFQNRYRDRFGSNPNFAAGMAFETTQILLSALEKEGGALAGLKQALLETHDFNGMNGTISMDPFGDVICNLYLSKLKDGQFISFGILPGEPP